MKSLKSKSQPVSVSFGQEFTNNNHNASSDSISKEASNQGKDLLLGNARSGAKFTPENHKNAGNAILDSILRGDSIPVIPSKIRRENKALYELGVRYFHEHLRQKDSREQVCDDEGYRDFAKALRNDCPDIAISFGGSRNGRLIKKAIQANGEWDRISQSALSLNEGGADFVTIQAAAELMIASDMERQGFIRYHIDTDRLEILRPLNEYLASWVDEKLDIGANSTAGGSDYGKSSAGRQLEVFQRAIAARGALGLPQEVEWTQLQRSYTLTKLAVEHMQPSLANTSRLNITILFGFSPLMPFPLRYEDFRRAVTLAKSIGQNGAGAPLKITVSVGAAVLPQAAAKLTAPLDLSAYTGRKVGPLERLIAYSCQKDSGVDLVRFGLEDTPYQLGANSEILPATNLDLGEFALRKINQYGGRVITDPEYIRQFVSAK